MVDMKRLAKEIGAKITYHRNLLGDTQLEFARKIKVSLDTLSGYERGIRPPDWERLADISNVLNINCIELIPEWYLKNKNN